MRHTFSCWIHFNDKSHCPTKSQRLCRYNEIQMHDLKDGIIIFSAALWQNIAPTSRLYSQKSRTRSWKIASTAFAYNFVFRAEERRAFCEENHLLCQKMLCNGQYMKRKCKVIYKIHVPIHPSWYYSCILSRNLWPEQHTYSLEQHACQPAIKTELMATKFHQDCKTKLKTH